MLLRAHSADASVMDTADAYARFDGYAGGSGTNGIVAGGPFSTGYFQHGYYSGWGGFTVPQRTTLFLGGYFLVVSSGAPALIRFRSGAAGGGTSLCEIEIGPDHSIRIREYDGTTHLHDEFATTGWQYYEFKVAFHATAGSIEVHRSGALLFTESNLNTCGAYTSGPLSVRTESPQYANQYLQWDDLSIWDDQGGVFDGFQGPVRMTPAKVNADGATADWTPSAGSDHYAMVDDYPCDEDGTYNESTTATDVDELELEAGPTQPILGVVFVARARKADAGSADLSVGVLSSASVQETTHTIADGSAYGAYEHASVVDPNTSAAWTEAGFNAAKLRYKNG